jgi:restriction system protein
LDVEEAKFVLQAKRYTRPVDVAAVRDLYGTVMNEGANRGILVTTSSYGPDSYEFAKGKPLSLVDGPNLIAMLKRHGRNFRIDLGETRRMDMEGSAV